jgi:hypothetical protein
MSSEEREREEKESWRLPSQSGDARVSRLPHNKSHENQPGDQTVQEGYLMQEDQLMGEEDPSNQRDEMVRSYLLKQEEDELMQTDQCTDGYQLSQLTRKDLLTHGDQLTLEQLARAFSHHAAAAELSTGTGRFRTKMFVFA